MAIDIKSIGLGAIVGSVVAGVLCWQIAFYRGHHKGGETERANAKEVVAGLLKELDYAKGQIDKVNSAHSAQIEALAANFLAEGEARLAAQKSMEVAVRATSQTATQAWTAAQNLRSTLQTVSDECARVGADPALVSMFNQLIATSFTSAGSNVPATNRDP
jgi:hypothetical protein